MAGTKKTSGKQRSKTSDAALAPGQLPDVVMSLRLEGSQHERLRKLAFDKRLPMRDFIVQGIEHILKSEKY